MQTRASEIAASIMEALPHSEPSVAELDWDEILSLLEDYDMEPHSTNLPLLPNPTELEHNYHHFCSPMKEQTEPMLTSFESYGEAPQHWEQPCPTTAFPDTDCTYMPAYWEHEGPVAAPDMCYPQDLFGAGTGALRPGAFLPGPFLPAGMVAPNPYYRPFGGNYWSEAGTHTLWYLQDQYQPYQWPKATFAYPMVPPQFSGLRAPEGMSRRTVRLLRRQKAAEELQEKQQPRPYVKKPQNAFMIFINQKRSEVVAQYGISDNAAVNKILGKRWRSMSSQEQAPFYQQAWAERCQHQEQNPDWSGKENYGKKRRRDRSKAARAAAAAAAANKESSELKRARQA